MDKTYITKFTYPWEESEDFVFKALGEREALESTMRLLSRVGEPSACLVCEVQPSFVDEEGNLQLDPYRQVFEHIATDTFSVAEAIEVAINITDVAPTAPTEVGIRLLEWTMNSTGLFWRAAGLGISYTVWADRDKGWVAKRDGYFIAHKRTVEEAWAEAQAYHDRSVRALLVPGPTMSPNQAQPGPADEVDPIDYAVHYLSGCRGCADEDGICPTRKLPCDTELVRNTARHVFKAWSYGIANGFMSDPFAAGRDTLPSLELKS